MPVWLPLYWRSRWTDFSQIAAEAAENGYSPLDQHVLFSSGWEWGYWQTDVLTLRQGYAGFDDWRDGNAWLWAPVARRHAALHYPHPERILTDNDNPTIYDYGYLTRADELCYWSRELAQLEDLAGQDASIPGCAF